MRGSHVLIARVTDGDRSEIGVEPIDPAIDLMNRLVRLEPAGTIAGRVETADGLPFTEQTVRVAALFVYDGKTMDPLGRDQVEASDNAQFVIGGLIGERRIEVYGLPAGWEIGQVLVGGTPATTITFSPGEHIVDVRVIVRRR
jgi:hypothetical protein